MIAADDAKIAAIDVLDVRFPASRLLDGSDAMKPDPDYSVLAAKFSLPVCPRAGGVGSCELVQHPSVFDHVA